MTDSGPNAPNSPQDEGSPTGRCCATTSASLDWRWRAVALANIIVLFLIDVTSAQPNPYVGILAYMVLPGFSGAGLALAVFGVWRERHRRLEAVPGLPRCPTST